MIKKIFLILVLIVAAFFSAQAQTGTPKVKERQVNQQVRIRQGVQQGDLNRVEQARLQKQQRSINRQKKVAKSDGIVTRKERASIHKRQSNASLRIYRQKNDGQNRDGN